MKDGILKRVANTRIMSGIHDVQYISPVPSRLVMYDSRFSTLMASFGDRSANKINDTKNAGIVVRLICLMWSNKSTLTMVEARLVVSDNGDILSPKNAPETIAPAVIASDASMALPIPIKATPIVAVVVSELPSETPIIAVTANTIA